MSDESHHSKFLFEVGKVLPQIIAKSVTRILGVRKDGAPPDYRGTALLCIVNGHPMFVTANHVLKEMDDSGNYKAVGVSAATGGFQAKYGRFEDIDIAVIIPEAEIRVGDECIFWPDGQWDHNASDSVMAYDYMIVYGFPARFSRYCTFRVNVHVTRPG